MINKTAYQQPKLFKLENDSTAYSEPGFPVLFHTSHKKPSQREHSEHTLFKEDTNSSHTDKQLDVMPQKPTIQVAETDSIDKFYQDQMHQLKRYIDRAQKINKVEMNQLQKAKKPFSSYKINNPIVERTKVELTKREERKQEKPQEAQVNQINRIRQIYVSRNVRKNNKTLSIRPKRENSEVYRYDVETNKNLTKITEDSHEEEILKKNNKRLAGRSSIYNKSNTIFVGKSDNGSRAGRYLQKIEQNDVRSSIEQLRPSIRKNSTFYNSHKTVVPDQRRYIESDDTSAVVSAYKTINFVEKREQATSTKTDNNEQKIANRLKQLQNQQFLQSLELKKAELRPKTNRIERPQLTHQRRQQFVQVPSVHQLVIGRDIETELKRQHQISESFNEQKIQWLIEQFKPHSQPFKHLDISQFVIKKYKNGVYFGQIREIDGKPVKQGHGSIFYYNGRLYEGQFSNDMKHGRGLELYPDNSRYEGYFENGMKSGKGRFTWSNGQIYDGQWLKGKKHGSGMWKSAGQEPYESYIGQWFEGRVEGFGVHTTVSGDRYEGQFKNSLKQGYGTQRFQSGDVYVGAYLKGRHNGQGQFYFKNGDVYKGQFCNGLKHGYGVLKQAETGNVFSGEFRNDKKCGQGQYVWNNGEIYVGNFQNDLRQNFEQRRHGYGEMQTSKGKVYRGYWVNGKMFGQNALNQENQPEKQSRKFYNPEFKTAKKIKNNQSKSKSPQRSRSKSKKKIHTISLEKSPEGYKRACGCARHH